MCWWGLAINKGLKALLMAKCAAAISNYQQTHTTREGEGGRLEGRLTHAITSKAPSLNPSSGGDDHSHEVRPRPYLNLRQRSSPSPSLATRVNGPHQQVTRQAS